MHITATLSTASMLLPEYMHELPFKHDLGDLHGACGVNLYYVTFPTGLELPAQYDKLGM